MSLITNLRPPCRYGLKAALLLWITVLLSGCAKEVQQADQEFRTVAQPKPQRIISLDFCADQYLLKLAEPLHILALSPDATAEFSYMREAAQGMPTVRPVAEDALVMQPDLIVRSYGGGANAQRYFEKAGVPVFNLGWANNLTDIQNQIIEVAVALGEPERGHALVEQMNQHLQALQADMVNSPALEALYITPGGVTTGPGSLIHEVLATAGLGNFQRQPGWHALPLERLVYEQPEMLAAGYFDTQADKPNHWSNTSHPVVKSLMRELPVARVEGASMACGAWFITDAIEALTKGRRLASQQIRQAQIQSHSNGQIDAN